MKYQRLGVGVFVILTLMQAALAAAPTPPTGLTAAVSGNSVTLSWSAPAALVTGYRLEAGTAPGLTNAANVVLGVTNTFATSDVPAGTYYVRVKAIGFDGESAASNEVVVVVTGAGGGCTTAPSAPSNLSAAVTGTLITFSWSPAGGCAATTYVLYAGSTPGATNLAAVGLGNTLQFTATAPNGTYYVFVVAQNAYGASSPSNIATVVVGAATPPVPGPTPSPSGSVNVNLDTASISANSFGDTVIIGEVINRSSQTVIFTKVNAALRNSAGATIGSDYTYVRGVSRDVGIYSSIITDTTLAPGEAGCFYLTIRVPRASVSRVSLTVEGDRDNARNLLGRPQIVGTPASSTSLGRVRLHGQVRNDGAVLTYFNKAVFYMQRSDSLAIGCDYQYVTGSSVRVSGVTTNTGLAPAQSGSFAITTHATAPAASMRMWTQWDEGGGTLADQALHALLADLSGSDEGSKEHARRLWRDIQAQREAAYRTQR